MGRAEWAIAIILTLIAVYFHFTFLTHAGALWRDEVNTAEFAGMPSLSSLYSSLQYDGFPLLSTLLVRGWMAAGWGSSDFGLRVFGFLVGQVMKATKGQGSPEVVRRVLQEKLSAAP